MEKNRQLKILSIVALVLAITGMTLGFAAFSATLNISSSASVAPSSDDFKITIYGVKDEESRQAFVEGGYIFKEEYFSTTSAIGVAYNSYAKAGSPVIDNNTHTIKNVSATISGLPSYVSYPILVRNEGQYDAYLDITDYINDPQSASNIVYMDNTGVCKGETGTTETLVNAACNSIFLRIAFTDKGSQIIEDGYLKIPQGEYALMSIIVATVTPDTYADGPYTVTFPDIELTFKTTK